MLARQEMGEPAEGIGRSALTIPPRFYPSIDLVQEAYLRELKAYKPTPKVRIDASFVAAFSGSGAALLSFSL